MSLQEDLLDNIECSRNSIKHFQDGLDLNISENMNAFYRGMIGGYTIGLSRLETMYRRYYKYDLELLEEIRQKYPLDFVK